MKALKRIGLVMVLASAAALSVFVYWNSDFYYRARKEPNIARKIVFLEKSNKSCPLNDLVFYELGKSHLDLAIENAGNPGIAGTHLRLAVSNLERALKINPYSPYSHFYLGQAVLQSEIIAPAGGPSPYDEFRKAALLAGGDHQIVDQAAGFFLSRWAKLSAGDQLFTLDLVKRVMAGEDRARISALLSVWEMNVGDPAFIERVLPRDVHVYRIYADFLGEKALLPDERHKYLAGAEQIEFEQARAELQSGEYALFQYQTGQARIHLSRALSLAAGIRFYQVFLPKGLISLPDFLDLERQATLDLVKCRVEEGAKLEDVEGDLNRYLSLEDRPKEAGALETYLRGRGILPEEWRAGVDDLRRLAFELLLQFKQGRYRDIVSLGRTLQKSLLVVPDDKKKDYVNVLRTVGDALQKVDFIYDAGETYRRALEIDPAPLGTLVRLRENYKRLNDEVRIKQVDEAIRKLETPEVVALGTQTASKRHPFTRTLIFGGEAVVLELRLKSAEPGPVPMVAVFFNDRVVWEDRPAGDVIVLRLQTKPGDNLLQVMPLNWAISLVNMSWQPGDSLPGPESPPLRSAN